MNAATNIGTTLFDKAVIRETQEAVDFMANVIQASTEYSIIGKDLDGKILLWNEGAHRLYGYAAEEVIGKANSEILHTSEDVAARKPKQILEAALRDGKWEGTMERVRKDRRRINAFVVITPRRNAEGKPIGFLLISKDITDRVRLENQWREEQTYLRGVIESLVDGLITVDPEGFIIDVNKQTCRMTGYDRTKLVGSPFRHYFTQPERADLAVKKTFADGVVTSYELVLRTRIGHKAAVSLNASRFRGEDELVQGLFVFARDISEQTRLQSELAEQQSYNRSLIEASADALFAIAPDGVITDVNAEATRLTGYTREHLTDSRFSTYFTDPKRARAGVQETIHEGRVIGYELVLITQQGKHIGVSFNAGVFTDATGATFGILAAARDITERKRAEAHFRGLLESAPEAMVIVNQEGRIILVNSQTEKLFGYDRHELLGQLVELLVPNRHRIDHLAHPLAHFQNPRTRSTGGGQELFGMRQDGTEFPVEVSFSPLETEEGILVIRDITERKLVERTIQEKNIELENANQAKDRFLTSMSHELRTPLNAIIGFTGTLLMKLPGPLNDEQEDQLQTVERSATHLLSLINDLLDLAKIESGNVELNLVSVPCQNVIDEVIEA